MTLKQVGGISIKMHTRRESITLFPDGPLSRRVAGVLASDPADSDDRLVYTKRQVVGISALRGLGVAFQAYHDRVAGGTWARCALVSVSFDQRYRGTVE